MAGTLYKVSRMDFIVDLERITATVLMDRRLGDEITRLFNQINTINRLAPMNRSQFDSMLRRIQATLRTVRTRIEKKYHRSHLNMGDSLEVRIVDTDDTLLGTVRLESYTIVRT
jgi:uncharacterized protein with PIN domain